MKVEEIIRQAEKLSDEEKEELAYYFLLTTLSEKKRDFFYKYFHRSTTQNQTEIKDWNFLGKISLEKNLDDINIRDYAHDVNCNFQ